MMSLLLAACTTGPGAPFATLEGAELALDLHPTEARDLGDRTLTNEGWEIEVHGIELAIASIHVDDLQGAVGVEFDPANPPAGYSLCHGGHCHADSGALVAYAEIEAELAGGTASFVPVWSFQGPWTVDALDAGTLQLPVPDEGPDVGQTGLRRFQIELDHVLVDMTWVEQDQRVPFALQLQPLPLSSGLEVAVDRFSEPSLNLSAQLTDGGRLFDDIDFTLSDADQIAASVTNNFGLVELDVEIQ